MLMLGRYLHRDSGDSGAKDVRMRMCYSPCMRGIRHAPLYALQRTIQGKYFEISEISEEISRFS